MNNGQSHLDYSVFCNIFIKFFTCSFFFLMHFCRSYILVILKLLDHYGIKKVVFFPFFLIPPSLFPCFSQRQLARMIWHLEQKGTIPFPIFLRKANGPGAVPGMGQGKKFPLCRFMTKSLWGSSGFAAAAIDWLSGARALGGRRKGNKFPEPLELYQLKLLKFPPAKNQSPFPVSKSHEIQLHNPTQMAQQRQAEQQSPSCQWDMSIFPFCKCWIVDSQGYSSPQTLKMESHAMFPPLFCNKSWW